MRVYDEDFIQLCRKQDKLAQKRLFDELYTPLFRTASRYLTDYSEAEDCVMKGFLKAFLNLNKFSYKEPTGLYFWMRRIVVNEALMVLRQRNNFFLSLEEELPTTAIENSALQKMAAEELNQLIRSLPHGYRTVFCLYVIDGYDHAEIAEQLGITESTSRTQLAKAKSKLKMLLETRNHENAKYSG